MNDLNQPDQTHHKHGGRHMQHQDQCPAMLPTRKQRLEAASLHYAATPKRWLISSAARRAVAMAPFRVGVSHPSPHRYSPLGCWATGNNGLFGNMAGSAWRTR